MDGSLAVAFWGISILLVLTPGLDWAYAISSGLRRGGAVPAVSGMLAGHLAATVLVAFGVAAVIASSDVAMTTLTLAGAGYLIWLGVAALRRPAVAGAGPSQVVVVPGRLFAKGMGVSLLNPKVFLLFLALLPQFASGHAAWPIGTQMIALGAIHVVNCAVVYYAVGFGAATVLAARPRAARVVTHASGAVMIVLGVILTVEKVVAHLP